MGAIKGKNGRDLVDAKEIKKRWKEYTKRLYNIQMVWLVTKRPDILEYEVKWALRSTAVNKASGCDEIPAELFKSLKMMPSRFCIHYVSKSGRLRNGHRMGRG